MFANFVLNLLIGKLIVINIYYVSLELLQRYFTSFIWKVSKHCMLTDIILLNQYFDSVCTFQLFKLFTYYIPLSPSVEYLIKILILK